MSDLDQIRRAILERPGDDGLRLIYADAADEAGDEKRAAFIRLQVELSHLPKLEVNTGHARNFCQAKSCGLCRAEELRWKEQVMINHDENHEQWSLAELLNPCHIRVGGRKAFLGPNGLYDTSRSQKTTMAWEWERGWMSRIEMSHDLFLQHAKTIFEWQPVTSVRLLDKDPQSPYWRWNTPGPFVWAPFTPFNAAHYGEANEIADAMVIDSPVQMLREFSTEVDAMVALSVSCVALGRRLADLPPLRP